jgi:TIGR02688 family protein
MDDYSSEPVDITALSARVRDIFGDLAIDKRRLQASGLLKRGVPGYVAEWALDTIIPGTGPLSPDEVERIQEWASRAIPRPDDQNLIRARLLSGEMVKVLTPLQIDIILNRSRQEILGRLASLGIHDAHVSEDLARSYPELLKGGMWGIAQLLNTEEGVVLSGFKPMQASVDLSLWREARARFSLAEWRALLLVSMGYLPSAFSDEEQTLILCRLLPLVQKNMHLIELAPKGTGKSFFYENISPRVRLVSGGNISPAVLFVNNANGLPGLLARFAVVVLDEVQTLRFEKPEEIVGGLKGYLANGQLTRGGLHQMASDCGLVLLANVLLDEHQNPVADPLIRDLPPFLQETAFLDRMRGILPGWKIRKLSGASFASSTGLKSDFFGDALLALREDLAIDQMCAQRVRLLGTRAYRRNEESVRAIASGLTKILFPHGQFTQEEFARYCVDPAIELRQLVWNQLYQLDAEYRQFDRDLLYDIS